MRDDFFISATGELEEKMRVAPVTSPDMSGLVIGYTFVVKTRISSSEPPVSSLKK